jgi:hypothetical protein
VDCPFLVVTWNNSVLIPAPLGDMMNEPRPGRVLFCIYYLLACLVEPLLPTGELDEMDYMLSKQKAMGYCDHSLVVHSGEQLNISSLIDGKPRKWAFMVLDPPSYIYLTGFKVITKKCLINFFFTVFLA